MPQMRRKERERSREWAIAQLKECAYVNIALIDGDRPYVVAVSPYVTDEALYFHSAKAGHKCDLLRANPQVCLNGVTLAEPWGEKATVAYRSVVARGRAQLLAEGEEKSQAIRGICDRFAPGNPKREDYATVKSHTCNVYKIVLSEVVGKENPKG